VPGRGANRGDARLGVEALSDTTAPRLSPARANLFIAALLAVFFYVALMSTANDFGLTYDEGIYMSTSGLALQWVDLLAHDPAAALSKAAIDHFWNADDEQPPLVKFLCAAGQVTFGRLWGGYALARAGTALLFALAAAGLFLFTTRLYGRLAGVFAAFALFTLPEVFAHAHLCALDVPIMSMMLLSLLVAEAASRRPGWGLTVLAGVVWGLTLACKVNAVFVPLFLVPWLVLFRRKAALKLTASLFLIGPAVFMALWPWMWYDTFQRLWGYARFQIRHYPVSVTYFGVEYIYAPWHYPIVMTVLKTPPVILALVIVGLVIALQKGVPALIAGLKATIAYLGAGRPPKAGGDPTHSRKPVGSPSAVALRAPQTPHSYANTIGLKAVRLHIVDESTVGPKCTEEGALLALMLLGALVNIGMNSLPNAPKYNGTRLWMPFYVYWAFFAAMGMHALVRLIQAKMPPGEGLLTPRRAGWLIAAVGIALPLRTLALVHPWEMSYYNMLIGGTAGADRRGMEVSYWGDTYLHPLLWLSEHAPPGATVYIEPQGMLSICKMYKIGVIRDDLRLTAGHWPQPVDYIVFQNKITEWTPVAKRLVATQKPAYTETLDGVPVFYVFGPDAIAAIDKE